MFLSHPKPDERTPVFPNFFATSSPEKSPPAQVARDERVYAIGDIHGRQDLLDAMLAKISDDVALFSDARRPRMVFLGDYIDRGDDSHAVIQTLSDIFHIRDRLKSETNVQIDFLAGNHEVALLDFLKDPIASSAWLDWGGLQTLASFGVLPAAKAGTRDVQRMRDELASALEPYLEFLVGLPRTIVSGDVVFVHAGLDPACALDAQPEEATLWGTPPSGRPMGMQGMRMVHGHFAASGPVSRPERICVDTGAYYSGCLTAVRLDDSEAFLSVTSAGSRQDNRVTLISRRQYVHCLTRFFGDKPKKANRIFVSAEQRIPRRTRSQLHRCRSAIIGDAYAKLTKACGFGKSCIALARPCPTILSGNCGLGPLHPVLGLACDRYQGRPSRSKRLELGG